MDDHLTIFSRIITKPKEEVFTLQDILNTYPYLKEVDLENGYDFEPSTSNGKIIPSIKFASEEDAREITQIFREVYDSTYPYKKMESVPDVMSMIRDPNYYWIIFKLKSGQIIGCLGMNLDFKQKLGNIFGFAFKKEIRQNIDIGRACLTSVFAPIYKFRDKILIWYGEARTRILSVQYLTKIVGMLPVAFLPKKDIFFNKPESEFLVVIYDRNVLSHYRSLKKPELISQVIFCYFYAFQKYSLELPTIKNYENIELSLDKSEIVYKRTQLIKRVERDKFDNELITYSIKHTDSFCQFIYYRNINTAEKTKYKVSNAEELELFLIEIKKLIKTSKLRYFEVHVSAYNSKHQALFFKAGFKPTGYIPAFKYNNTEHRFEDQVVFIYYNVNLEQKIALIPETKEFLKTIRYFKEV
jgi:hypothetical protein